MKKTLLVTGGAGFIGSNFIHYWLQNHPEDTVINLDLLTYAGNLANLETIASNPQYTFVKGDIGDTVLVNKLMQDVDLVVHFAAESHVDRSILNPSVFVTTNVLGTQVLLEAALKAKVKHFHHISTDEVFGSLDLGTNTTFNEHTPYDPRSPYSASKAGSDHLVRAYGETYGLSYTITNCSNNYGEYQFPEKLIPLAITNILEGKPVPIYGDGMQVRDWLYVQDHCSAIDRVIQSGQKSKTYVVGGLTEDIPNKEVIAQIIELMGASKDLLVHIKDRAGHDKRYSVDWSLIQKELDWKPSVTLAEGLLKTINWYKNNTHIWQKQKQNSKEFFATNYSP